MVTTNEIRQSIVVKANRERVWRALTQPKHFSNWFGMKIEFPVLAVGEAMIFDPNGFNGKGRIAAIQPMDQFAFYWTAEPGLAIETLVTFQLETVADGTQVTVTDVGYDALPESVVARRFRMNNDGWAEQMDNIAKYVEKEHDD